MYADALEQTDTDADQWTDAEMPGLSPMTGSRLRLVYVGGIALNVVALVAAAIAGDWLISVTFGVVIVYLCFRYWLLTSPDAEDSTERTE